MQWVVNYQLRRRLLGDACWEERRRSNFFPEICQVTMAPDPHTRRPPASHAGRGASGVFGESIERGPHGWPLASTVVLHSYVVWEGSDNFRPRARAMARGARGRVACVTQLMYGGVGGGFDSSMSPQRVVTRHERLCAWGGEGGAGPLSTGIPAHPPYTLSSSCLGRAHGVERRERVLMLYLFIMYAHVPPHPRPAPGTPKGCTFSG